MQQSVLLLVLLAAVAYKGDNWRSAGLGKTFVVCIFSDSADVQSFKLSTMMTLKLLFLCIPVNKCDEIMISVTVSPASLSVAIKKQQPKLHCFSLGNNYKTY